jgi:hypothetical protein
LRINESSQISGLPVLTNLALSPPMFHLRLLIRPLHSPIADSLPPISVPSSPGVTGFSLDPRQIDFHSDCPGRADSLSSPPQGASPLRSESPYFQVFDAMVNDELPGQRGQEQGGTTKGIEGICPSRIQEPIFLWPLHPEFYRLSL